MKTQSAKTITTVFYDRMTGEEKPVIATHRTGPLTRGSQVVAKPQETKVIPIMPSCHM